MSYPSPVLDGFDALAAHPLHWLARQFVFYCAVAVVAAVAAVTAAGIYSYNRQISPVEHPSTVPLPDRRPNLEKGNPSDPLDQLRGALVARHSGKEIGVPIYMHGSELGRVTSVWLDEKGVPQGVTVERTDSVEPKTIIVPYRAVNWQSKEQTEFTWQHGAQTVKGSLRQLWGEVEEPVGVSNP